ncbi:MAG: hypothetical protein ABIN97_09585 [Ginsengibacter sp.]
MVSSNNPRLNEQQLDMIRLFKDPMPEEDFIQMRRLAVQLLSKRLNAVMDSWETDNNFSEETYEKWSKEHIRSSYKCSE